MFTRGDEVVSNNEKSGNIHVYDYRGYRVGVYEDIYTLAKEKDMNVQRVKAVLKGKGDTTKNYFLFDDAIYPTEMDRQQRIDEIRLRRTRRFTASDEQPIIAYDMKGNRVAEYQTIKAAISDLKLNPILLKNVLRGDANSTKGMLFIYKDASLTKEDQDQLIKKRIHKIRTKQLGKAVNQYTLEGEYIATFENMSIAGRELGILHSSIAACANGSIRKAGGFIFLYADLAQDNLNQILQERVNKNKPKMATSKQSKKKVDLKQLIDIYHYDSSGEFVGVYEDARHVFYATGVTSSTLKFVVSGHTLRTGKGIFLLGADFSSEEARQAEVAERLLRYGQSSSGNGRTKRRVELYDTDGKLINTYPSVGQAARENNLVRQQLKSVLEGDKLSIDGKVFKYAQLNETRK